MSFCPHDGTVASAFALPGTAKMEKMGNSHTWKIGWRCFCDSAPCHWSETSERQAADFFFSRADTNKKPSGVVNLNQQLISQVSMGSRKASLK